MTPVPTVVVALGGWGSGKYTVGPLPGQPATPRIYLHKGMPIGATAHQAGTVRFGDDPKSSALDVNCKAHDLDNLYVVDTSFFPSIGAVNPSLTAIANALRVGDRIAARLR